MLIPWWLPVGLSILLIHTFYPWFRKKYVVAKDLEERFLLQYCLCAVAAFLIALLLRQIRFDGTMLLILSLGVANGFAAFCQWKATFTNLSKLSVLAVLDDSVAITLGYLFLDEKRFLNRGLLLGLLLAAITAFLFVLNDARKNHPGVSQTLLRVQRLFYFYVLSYSLIWGIYGFSKRYFALEGTGKGTFFLGWYGGSLLSALIIFFVAKRRTTSPLYQLAASLNKNTSLIVAGSCAFVMTGLALSYWSSQLAPLVVTEPYYLLAEMVIPAATGLILFREGRSLELKEKIPFALGVLAALLIALNYH